MYEGASRRAVLRSLSTGRAQAGEGDAPANGFIQWHDDVPAVEDDKRRYWLLLELRTSAVDREPFKPIGHATPVLPSPQ